ncbi:MAG: NAD-dependent epimerase/dehydratase family protein [Candidatus Nanopelagicaceae bacterium]|nr:NAD-dependent epimerase/dehydratase family protein [Candidatus Nanopelagicaceae bacterium]
MRILILGGGAFVGRALVEASLSRGHEVTTVTRTALPKSATYDRVESIFSDRTKPDAFDFTKDRQWDAVFDTWFNAPHVVQKSATALRNHVPYYSYVSSCSVYNEDPLPIGLNENSPVIEADPSAERTNYSADKRGAELAILESYGANNSFFARGGMILGPYEIPGRLPWWLKRIARGGEVLAPGPSDLGLQYIDARDLAMWMVACAEQKISGAFNSVSPVNHATMSDLLEMCRRITDSDAHFTWMPPDFLQENDIQPWIEMPIWVSPTLYGIYGINTGKAAKAGLRCRSLIETVVDTWEAMQSDVQPELNEQMTPPGISADKEASVLAAWASKMDNQ